MSYACIRRLVALCTVAIVAVFSAFAGDPTPPPGPVDGTMKTLTEVEPRIAVNSVNTPGDIGALFIIDQPGSYYLTGNIIGEANKRGIEINSDDVTLDLNGFALTGVVNSSSGIFMGDFQARVVIRNGSISDWGQYGALLAIDSGSVENLHVDRNGLWGITMSGTYGSRVSGCTLVDNGGEVGMPGGGLRTGLGATVENCTAYNNTGVGIQVETNSVVSHCAVASTNDDSNAGQGGDGIITTSSGNVIESSTSSGNAGNGIDVGGSANLVRGCNASGNGGTNVVASGTSQVIDTLAP